ncbi:hypothetical protein CVV68_08620 [Arthrobacter livingstonensis]|uniref:Uncharacterized protein n=1 Tax=Arthrobacter livingstonensis TaxID=670078 RepID=A0A2V5LDN5_9MICC|nr:hypothetical protein [Arthrobacter livingstonensis]PYI67913.1 hypothetical protein CVV68_08620 [Arthrobacter livingstonensis]
MDGIGDILFGPIYSAPQALSLGLRILGVLIMCAALVFLGRRSELGWWLVIASFAMSLLSGMLSLPFGFLSSPLGVVLYIVGSWIPLLVGAAVAWYGLLCFRRAAVAGPMVRDLYLRNFHATDAAAPLVVAVVFAAAGLIPAMVLNSGSPGAYGSGPGLSIPLAPLFLSGFLQGFLPAGLVGLAHRSRWAWLLIAASAVFAMAGIALSARGSVLIFLFMAQAALALYGFVAWGRLRRDSAVKAGA